MQKLKKSIVLFYNNTPISTKLIAQGSQVFHLKCSVHIPLESDVELKIEEMDGQSLFATGIVKQSSSQLLLIEITSKTLERRRYFRVNLEAEGIARFTENPQNPSTKDFPILIDNISIGGIHFTSIEPIFHGNFLYTHFHVEDHFFDHILCKVERCILKKKIYHVGCSFFEIPDDKKELIHYYVQNNLEKALE
jgi:c-di-GMP-binding flagellar brake protein YcgR